jgi:ATP-dependent exoDNAse (exonuclease V) alpha subunit
VKQAQQLCMISLELDSRIRAGVDFDKLLSSYDKLVKVAEFTPKNAKNASDFDSVGELFHWLEKAGWRNKYYDGATRDELDEMMKNFENYNQRLYINESGIAEEIARRTEQLKSVNEAEHENFYNLNTEFDLDEYDNEGYEDLMGDEDFKEEV